MNDQGLTPCHAHVFKSNSHHAASKPALAARLLVAVLVVAWGAAVLAGMGVLTQYQHTPGESALPPGQWPPDSRLARSESGATLVMFVHPRCPCSRASLSELELVIARHHDQLRSYVVFLQPDTLDDDWSRTDLWKHAAAIPQVVNHVDRDGREARRFQARTSGQTMLYDRDGRLLFSGGITASRGHAGDNLGRTSISSLLGREPTRPPQHANCFVFGCPLFQGEVSEN